MMDGEVESVNDEIRGMPAKVNSNAEDGGWIMQVRVSDESQLDQLLSREDYEKLL